MILYPKTYKHLSFAYGVWMALKVTSGYGLEIQTNRSAIDELFI
jgi:hypothetical protein